jgi:glycosyltransferase involved in cell wall biosynthesis
MKIAHIAPPWIAIPPKNYGGTEIVLSNLIEEQVAQGHDVTLFAPGDAKTSARLVSFFARSLIGSGVPWQAHLKAYYHYTKAAEYIKSHQFDMIHTHLSSASDMYIYPLLDSISTPVISTLHSRFPFDRVASWTGDADQYYLEWLASAPMIAISESARADVSYRLNFVGVIHHGLPMEIFCPTTEQPDDFLVWLGRFFPEKGAHLAIEAAKAAGRPLVIAGTIDQHVPDSVNYFERMIKPHIDDQQIRYIGPVDKQQKIDLLGHAYGLLNPIEWNEPFGMVMIEAMSVGCPVISFAQGAAPEIVQHGKSGFLVHDLEEMIAAIGKLGTLNRKAIRAHVEQNFSVKVMAEKYTRAYRKVITSSLLEASVAQVPLQAPVTHVRTAPLTAPTSIARPTTTTLALSPLPTRSKTSPLSLPTIRSKPSIEPDIDSLS